jgi:hypothetical protein
VGKTQQYANRSSNYLQFCHYFEALVEQTASLQTTKSKVWREDYAGQARTTQIFVAVMWTSNYKDSLQQKIYMKQ